MPQSAPQHGPALSARVIADARAFIRRRMSLPDDAELALSAQLHLFRGAALTVRKATRAQHLEAVAFAYAVYAEGRLHPGFEGLVKELADSIGKKITKRTDALHVILQAVISYGGDTKAEQSDARRLYSRDAQAVRYLISKQIAPSATLGEGSKKGQGLDAWAVAMRSKPTAAPSGKLTDPDSVAPASGQRADRSVQPGAMGSLEKPWMKTFVETCERTMVYEITIKEKYGPSGKIKGEHFYSVTGLLDSEKNELLEGIKRLPQAKPRSTGNHPGKPALLSILKSGSTPVRSGGQPRASSGKPQGSTKKARPSTKPK